MTIRPFRLIEPTTVAEATAELARLGDQAKVYAGGAELLLLMRHGLLQPDVLLNIKRLWAMDAVTWDGQDVRIGSTVTHHRLELDPLIRERLPMLLKAESDIGNIRVRNQGTIGGNLCFADPHSDPPAPLLVHEAVVRIAGPGREREVALDQFLVGTYETALEPDEILTDVLVPPLPGGFGHAFLRVERYHRPTINVAVAVSRRNGRLDRARIAVGCIGPRAMRLPELERRVQGLTLGEAQRVIAELRTYLGSQLDPVDDLLGPADYKLHLARVLLGRGLRQAFEGRAEDGHV